MALKKGLAPSLREAWITREEMRAVCPDCADRMGSLNLKRVNLAQMPPQLKESLCAKFSPEEGFYTRCSESSFGENIDDIPAYCAWLHKECTGKWPGERGEGTTATAAIAASLPDGVAEALARDLLTWVAVMPAGTFVHPISGEWEIRPAHLAQMVASFNADGGAARPCSSNYLHATMRGAVDTEESRASGEIYALEVRQVKWPRYEGPALYALTRFTDEAREMIASGLYRYPSAEFSFDHQDEGVGEPTAKFFHFTLTPDPFFGMLPPITLAPASTTLAASAKEKQIMPGNIKAAAAKKAQEERETLSQVVADILGLKPEATEDEIIGALRMVANIIHKALGHEEEAPAAPPEGEPPAMASATPEGEPPAMASATPEAMAVVNAAARDVVTLGARVKMLEADNAKLQAERHTATLAAMLDTASRGGKLTSAMRKLKEEQYGKLGADLGFLGRELAAMPVVIARAVPGEFLTASADLSAGVGNDTSESIINEATALRAAEPAKYQSLTAATQEILHRRMNN